MSNSAPYHQIAAAIRADIASGRLRVGDKLPSRAELAAAHQAAPMTVQNALRQLREEGLVRSEQGRGVFVAALPAVAGFEVVQVQAEVHECTTCCALVRPERWPGHVQWHAKRQES